MRLTAPVVEIGPPKTLPPPDRPNSVALFRIAPGPVNRLVPAASVIGPVAFTGAVTLSGPVPASRAAPVWLVSTPPSVRPLAVMVMGPSVVVTGPVKRVAPPEPERNEPPVTAPSEVPSIAPPAANVTAPAARTGPCNVSAPVPASSVAASCWLVTLPVSLRPFASTEMVPAVVMPLPSVATPPALVRTLAPTIGAAAATVKAPVSVKVIAPPAVTGPPTARSPAICREMGPDDARSGPVPSDWLSTSAIPPGAVAVSPPTAFCEESAVNDDAFTLRFGVAMLPVLSVTAPLTCRVREPAVTAPVTSSGTASFKVSAPVVV